MAAPDESLEKLGLTVESFDALARLLVDHPTMVARRRTAVRFALFFAAIVAGVIALAIGRWVSLDPINEGIRSDNETCKTRIENIAGTAQFRDDYRDTLQNLASYFRDMGSGDAADELDTSATTITDPQPAGCDPNRDEIGFFG